MVLRKTSYRIDEDLLGAFRILCKEWGVTPSLVIRQSIKAWVRQGSLAPLFDEAQIAVIKSKRRISNDGVNDERRAY